MLRTASGNLGIRHAGNHFRHAGRKGKIHLTTTCQTKPGGEKAMQHTDPLDQLAILGLKVAWVTDLGEQVSFDPEIGVVMADPELCRREIARQTLELWRMCQEGDGSWTGELPDAS